MELLKERERDQRYKISKTMRDIEEVSFRGKERDEGNAKKTVTFGDGTAFLER